MSVNAVGLGDKRLAVLVHLNGMERVIPLAGGYLKAYAFAEPEIEARWDIQLYSVFVDAISASRLITDIYEAQPDLVGFSVYVWNAGLVRRVLPALRLLLPQTTFILGGTEVLNRSSDFIDPHWENVLVCNGEGEKTFRDLLGVLLREPPAFDQIGGVSYFQGGELKTTEPYARIKSLDEVPSPYLKGYFDKRDYSVALLETNRGCPYQCEFCFWGGATGQKITRTSYDRLHAEIELLGQNKARAVYICDANFGIFEEDVDLARKFVRTKKECGFPHHVRYSSAKNNPERALEVAKTLAHGGVLSVQPLSLQSLNEHALKLAGRDAIRHDSYYRLQARTNDLGIASFIELIWPLPGETLATFKKGLQDLTRMDAQSFSVYPLIWLNNVGYNGKEEEYGVVTIGTGDQNSSAKTVIQTREVSFADWIEGLLYTNAVQILHGCRALYHTCTMAEGLGVATREAIFARFHSWMDQSSGTELSRLWHLGRQKVDEIYSTLSWPGHLIEQVLHFRSEFDEFLLRFIAENPDLFRGTHAETIAAAVEFDMLARPYVYRNTSISSTNHLRHIRVLETLPRGWVIECPYDIPREAALLREGRRTAPVMGRTVITIDHDNGQLFRMARRTQKEYWDECRLFVLEMGNHYPTWQHPPQPDLSEIALIGKAVREGVQ